MDELPSEAKSILTLAKSAQPKADPGARERVRTRVDAALAGTLIATHGEDAARSLGKLSDGKTLLTHGKIMLASAVLFIGGGSMLWAKHAPDVSPRKPAPSIEMAAPQSAAHRDHPPLVPAEAEVTSEAKPLEVQPASRAPAPAQIAAKHAVEARGSARGQNSEKRFSLAAEMSLLEQATDALAKRDTVRARALLLDHRKRFANAQLREEREGLWVLVRCQEEPAQAQGEAAAFVRKSPTSLLAMRVKHACGLGDGT